jgi:hypothetical protein
MAFADDVTRLARDRRLWTRLAREGTSHIRGRHGRRMVRSQFLQVIESLLARERPASKKLHAESFSSSSTETTPYDHVVCRVRDTICSTVPPGATVVVVSRGDDELVKLDGRRGWHFPRTKDGLYAGWYPSSSAEAISQLEELRVRGGEYLVIPCTGLWWLDYYKELAQHLERHYRLVANEEETCLIYALTPPGERVPGETGDGDRRTRGKESGRHVVAA